MWHNFREYFYWINNIDVLILSDWLGPIYNYVSNITFPNCMDVKRILSKQNFLKKSKILLYYNVKTLHLYLQCLCQQKEFFIYIFR